MAAEDLTGPWLLKVQSRESSLVSVLGATPRRAGPPRNIGQLVELRLSGPLGAASAVLLRRNPLPKGRFEPELSTSARTSTRNNMGARVRDQPRQSGLCKVELKTIRLLLGQANVRRRLWQRNNTYTY